MFSLQYVVLKQHLIFFCLSLTTLSADSISMRFIPLGSYWMGDDSNLDDEQPKHFVGISELFVDTCEISVEQWDKVSEWAIVNGYEFSKNQDGVENWRLRKDGPSWYSVKDAQFPINMINWYDAVKWCNARSEFEGRMPLYYVNFEDRIVYKTGEIDLDASNVNWEGSGYRLPTEAEWEKFARGGVHLNYPWGDYIDGSKANYKLSGDPFDDAITPLRFFDGNQHIVKRSNSFGGEDSKPIDTISKYGLYDLIGNVSEWCWDWYDDNWYSQSKSKETDTRGPTFDRISRIDKDGLFTRVARGGNFKSSPDLKNGNELRIAYRGTFLPSMNVRRLGIRCVRANKDDPLWIRKKAVNGFPNWYHLDWLGYYWESENLWIYHFDFGWVYPDPNGKGSYDNWLYLPKHGWVWTCKYAYPFFYSHSESTWYEYDNENLELGWFKNHLTEKKIRWGRLYP